MMNRAFVVTTVVTGCNSCPYMTEDEWCNKASFDVPEGYEQLYRENKYKLTTSCPLYYKSIPKETL